MEALGALLLKYYAVDWLAMALTFASLVRLKAKLPSGFLLGAAAAAAWTVMNVMAGSVSGVIANVIFLVINLQSWKCWQEPAVECAT